jgi:hypothetical protein
MARALQSCTRLVTLTLQSCEFNSAQMCKLLPCLPELRELTLRHACNLESLQCFSQGTITRTLTRLLLSLLTHQQLAADELEHVCALQALTHFTIDSSFATPLGPWIKRLSTPSAAMPALIDFTSQGVRRRAAVA